MPTALTQDALHTRLYMNTSAQNLHCGQHRVGYNLALVEALTFALLTDSAQAW